MDRPPRGNAQQALEAFLGRWAGTTQWQATPWGPARTAAVEVVFSRAAAGLAVTHRYRYTEADGTPYEGQGVFTADPELPDTLYYHVNSMGLPPEPPARASFQGGTLTMERRSERGTARHTFRVEDGVLTHTAGFRLGRAGQFVQFVTTVCRRAPEEASQSAAVPAWPSPCPPPPGAPSADGGSALRDGRDGREHRRKGPGM